MNNPKTIARLIQESLSDDLYKQVQLDTGLSDSINVSFFKTDKAYYIVAGYDSQSEIQDLLSPEKFPNAPRDLMRFIALSAAKGTTLGATHVREGGKTK